MTAKNKTSNIWIAMSILGLVFIVATAIYLANVAPKKPTSTSAQVGNAKIYQVGHAMPANEVRGYVYTSQNGFMVVHTTNQDGQPAEVIGTSGMINGESELITIPLSQQLSDGQTISVTLYQDNGDGQFNASQDNPFVTENGTPAQFLLPIYITH